MRRVVVMGPPGSGKSTLARQIGLRMGLPVFHLDQVHWQAGWVEAPRDSVQAEVERLSALPAWVIDGNYSATIGLRLRAADTVILLDAPSWLSLLRIARRTLANHGRVRPDAAAGCPERLDWEFLRFAWSWNRTRRAKALALVQGFAGRRIILGTKAERRRFLAGLP